MSRTDTDMFVELLTRGLIGAAQNASKDAFVEIANENKKLYDAHISVGFSPEQALAITCALLQ